MLLVQVQQFETGTRFSPEILHKCGKTLETKPGRGGFLPEDRIYLKLS